MRFYVFALVFICFAGCKEKFNNKTYEDNKQSLAEKEKIHPQEFLKLTADDKKNLFGATVIKGKIVNTASVCSYKTVRVKILCYHNGIRVEEHEDVFPDLIKPGESSSFKTKYRLPKGTDSLALSIMSAESLLASTN
jgi:hypothetical protein